MESDDCTGAVVASLCGHDGFRLAMVHLSGATLRLPRDQSGDAKGSSSAKAFRVASLSLAVLIELLLPGWVVGEPAFRAVCMHSFLCALLRTQALQAASRQLAALADTLPAAAAAASAGPAPAAALHGGAALPQPLRDCASYAGLVARFVYCLVAAMCLFDASKLAVGAAGQLVWELVEALRDSGALEHAARGLLPAAVLMPELLTSAPRVESTLLFLASQTYDALDWAVRGFWGTDGGRAPADAVDTADATLRALLRGPCSQHAMLALGLAALCEADGGPAYGTPPALLAALSPARGDGEGDEGGEEAAGAILAMVLKAFVGLLRLGGRDMPPGRRGALALVFRVGWLAVGAGGRHDGTRAAVGGCSSAGASSGSGAGAGASGGSGAGAGISVSSCAGSGVHASGGGGDASLPRSQLPPNCACPLLSSALSAAVEMLPVPKDSLPWLADATETCLPKDSLPWLADATETWRLFVAMTRRVLRYADVEECVSIGNAILRCSLTFAYVPETGELRLPARPPPAVAAALAGGLLPCLERLLRVAGLAPAGPEARVVRAMWAGDASKLWGCWSPLLAYGEPRQAAALVATVGKLLRRIDPRVFVSVGLRAQPGAAHFVLCVAAAARMAAGPEGAPAGSPRCAPQQQLMSLLSCAACAWLPPLAALARQALALAGGARGSDVGRHNVFALLEILLRWACVLAARCEARIGAGGSASGGAGGSSGAAAGGAKAVEAGSETGRAGAGTGGGGGVGPETADAGAGDGGRVGPETADAGAGDGGWAALLLEEVGAVPLLGAALELAPRLGEAEISEGGEEVDSVLDTLERLVEACHAVASVHVWKAEQAPAEADVAPAGAEGSGRAATTACPLPDTVAGEGGALACDGGGPRPVAGAAGAGAASVGGVPAVLRLSWRPESLRGVATQLRACGRHGWAEEAAEQLAEWLETGGGEGPIPIRAAADTVAAQLPPPATARRLLRTCANPRCTNLDGDSEAGLPLKGCSGCGAAGYCGRPCQTAHWRAGHKLECEGRQRAGAGDASGRP